MAKQKPKKSLSSLLENNSVNDDQPFNFQKDKTETVEMSDDEFLSGLGANAAAVDQNKMFDINMNDFEEENISSGGEYWNFERFPEFIGTYIKEVQAREDNEDRNVKAGDCIGYEFIPYNHKQSVIIPNNFLITDAIEKCEPGDIFRISFLGKKKQQNGRQFTNFRVSKLNPKKSKGR